MDNRVQIQNIKNNQDNNITLKNYQINNLDIDDIVDKNNQINSDDIINQNEQLINSNQISQNDQLNYTDQIDDDGIQNNQNGIKQHKKSIFNIFDNINLKKNIKLIVPLIVLTIITISYFISNNDIFSKSEQSSKDIQDTAFTTALSYINQIENKLQQTLSNINGAGQVSVIISIDSSPELVIANNVEQSTVTTSSGSTVTVYTKPIMVGENQDEPLITMEKLPEIKGVVVVSSGASNVNVKLNLQTAVQVLLNLPTAKIEVFEGV